MAHRSTDDGYDLVEVFAIVFVVGDVSILAVLLVAGPLYAIALALCLLVGGVAAWYLNEAVRRRSASKRSRDTDRSRESRVDPVTRLQQRYAAGDLSEQAFEARLDRIIEANRTAEAAGVETEPLSLDDDRQENYR